MRRIRVLAGTLTLLCAAAVSAEAQTITLVDNSSARGSLRLGYGGHGPDWDASIDSPLFANLVRFRAGMGIGKWDSEFDSHPDPTVTRSARPRSSSSTRIRTTTSGHTSASASRDTYRRNRLERADRQAADPRDGGLG